MSKVESKIILKRRKEIAKLIKEEYKRSFGRVDFSNQGLCFMLDRLATVRKISYEEQFDLGRCIGRTTDRYGEVYIPHALNVKEPSYNQQGRHHSRKEWLAHWVKTGRSLTRTQYKAICKEKRKFLKSGAIKALT